MKFVVGCLSVVVLFASTGVAAGWDLDPECCAKYPEECDRRLAEGELLFNQGDSSNVLADIQEEKKIQLARQSLRGGSQGRRGHRGLDDDFEFQMRMHWEEGFCWQAEAQEKFWCMQCEGNTCNEGDVLNLQRCDEDEDNQWFTWDPVTTEFGRLKVSHSGKNLCLERTSWAYQAEFELQECDSNRDKQLLSGWKESGAFKLRIPEDNKNRCLSNPHFPKLDEIIVLEDCKAASKINTALWIVYNPEGDYEGPPTEPPSMSPSASPTLSVEPTISPAPTRAPSASPTRSPTDLLGITVLKDDCTEDNKCGRCEGDCDNDDQCEGDLVCVKDFDTLEDGTYPGCSGTITTGEDFCVDPADIPVGLESADCSESNKCERCQGDCDGDNQCEDGLVCFQNEETEDDTFPGCAGFSDNANDYCVDPSDIPSPAPTPDPTEEPTTEPTEAPTSIPTTAPITSSPTEPEATDSPTVESPADETADPTSSPTAGPTSSPMADPVTPNPTESEPLNTATGSPTAYFIEISGDDGDCTEDNKCGRCQGDCDNDNQCEGELVCRKDYEKLEDGTFPGCSGTTTSLNDYCVHPGDIPAEPTASPTPSPTPSPTAAPTTPAPTTEVLDLGTATGSPTYYKQIRDSDEGDCSSVNPCRQCEGDCNGSDGECEGDLVCHHDYDRVGGKIPGCGGISLSFTDYCVKQEDIDAERL